MMEMNKSMTLVCFAVEQEAGPFRKLARVIPEARIIVTGMGTRNAKSALQTALEENSFSRVITGGFAGGLNPRLPLGAVVFDADEGFTLARSLSAAGAVVGRFHWAERVKVTAGEKKAVWDATRLDAVEMESGVIRAACRERGIPSATVRVISDAADEDLPIDFNRFMTPDQRIDYPRLIWALARSPATVPALLRFARDSRAAAARLAEVLAKSLSAPGEKAETLKR